MSQNNERDLNAKNEEMESWDETSDSYSRRGFLKTAGFAMAFTVGSNIPVLRNFMPTGPISEAQAYPNDLKYIVSSDSRYIYFLDKDFANVHSPIHKSAIVPNGNAPLDTVLTDPIKGPEYMWAATEYNTSGDPNNPTQIYSFKVVDGVVSNVQSFDISHLVPTLNQLESMCIDPQNRKILLADSPNQVYICDENLVLIKTIDLSPWGYHSPQGICYVPWLDGYLIADNYAKKLIVINEAEELLWEIHFDRLDPVPTNPQGVAVDYATDEILMTYYQPSDAVVRMNWGGIQQAVYPNTLWEPTITYANPTSIAIVQNQFR